MTTAKSATTGCKNRPQAIITKASANAARSMRCIRGLSKILADEMQEIHGGAWSIEIDHDSQFILIAARL